MYPFERSANSVVYTCSVPVLALTVFEGLQLLFSPSEDFVA